MTPRAIPGPHHPTKATSTQINAVKALFAGAANEGQQKAALGWIIHHSSGLDDLSYRPADTHATAFAEGKRRVGLDIKRLIEMPGDEVDALAKKEQETKRGR